MRNNTVHASARVDMRGFRYELEPLQNRRQWQLDAFEARLGAAQRAVAQQRALLAELQARQAREAGLAAQALQGRLDAAVHRRTLAYLAQLQARAQVLRAELARLEQVREVAQAECFQGRQRLDVLLAHREDAVQAHAALVDRQQATEADRDWLARLQWQGTRPPGLRLPEAP